MPKSFLRVLQPVNGDADLQVLTQFLPEIRHICSNKIRAGILHIMISCPESMHSIQVEELSFKIGVRQSVCIHHLEKLNEWKLVDVKKCSNHGNISRRCIWGLDLRHPSWILECYRNIRNYFFTEKELEEITSKNVSFR